MIPEMFLFDVGNVIIEADEDITIRILKQFGIPMERASLFFRNEDYNKFCRSQITAEEFYQALITKHFQHKLSYWQVVDAHNRHIYKANEATVDLIKRLRENCHDIGFVTDGNTWQTARERDLIDLKKHSDIIFRSHENGMLKTDDGFFLWLARRLGENPRNLCLIDDSPEKVKKAKETGYRTILYKDSIQLERELGQMPA